MSDERKDWDKTVKLTSKSFDEITLSKHVSKSPKALTFQVSYLVYCYCSTVSHVSQCHCDVVTCHSVVVTLCQIVLVLL